MGETIEAFVDRIRTDGVQAGKAEAEKLLADAQTQAQAIIAQAERDKDKLLADAKRQADGALARGRTELELAARDASLRLRDALARALRAVLASEAQACLSDAGFVAKVLHEIITQYAKSDLAGKGAFEVNVSPEMQHELTEWAIAHVAKVAGDSPHTAIDLKGMLKQAGFEYNATGATVEVTVESVVEVLSDLVNPRLREILEAAMAEQSE